MSGWGERERAERVSNGWRLRSAERELTAAGGALTSRPCWRLSRHNAATGVQTSVGRERLLVAAKTGWEDRHDHSVATAQSSRRPQRALAALAAALCSLIEDGAKATRKPLCDNDLY